MQSNVDIIDRALRRLRRRRRRFVCTGAPPICLYRRAAAAEGLPLSGIFSYCIFHLLDLIAIYFKNQKITIELNDCKLQVATKCRSLNSYLFILCIAYHVTIGRSNALDKWAIDVRRFGTYFVTISSLRGLTAPHFS